MYVNVKQYIEKSKISKMKNFCLEYFVEPFLSLLNFQGLEHQVLKKMMTPESHVLHLSTSLLPIAGEVVYSLVVEIIFIILTSSYPSWDNLTCAAVFETFKIDTAFDSPSNLHRTGSRMSHSSIILPATKSLAINSPSYHLPGFSFLC